MRTVTRIDMIRTTSIYVSARRNGSGIADAVAGVRRHWAFMKTLRADVKAADKRRRAAKKGWKTRRANAS